MKKFGTYYVNPPKKRGAKKARKKNPLPFAAIVANPKRRKKSPGLWVAKKPTRNPKRKKRRAKIQRNTAPLGALSIPSKKRRTSRRNPVSDTQKTMSKSRRRGRKSRKRNPVTSRGGSRRSSRRRSRNPRSRRMRNPLPIVNALFPMNTLAVAGSAIAGGVVINTLVNKLAVPTATRSFKLPGIDSSMLASPDAMVRATFWKKNAIALALYKAVAGAGIGYALRNQAPRLGQGIALGGFIAAGTQFLQAQNIVTVDGTLQAAGTGRMYLSRPGAGFVPGVNPQFTGPGQAFLGFNNVPQPRGAGARVNRNTMRQMENSVEGAFKGAN